VLGLEFRVQVGCMYNRSNVATMLCFPVQIYLKLSSGIVKSPKHQPFGAFYVCINFDAQTPSFTLTLIQ